MTGWTSSIFLFVFLTTASTAAGDAFSPSSFRFSPLEDIVHVRSRNLQLGEEYGKHWILMSDGKGQPQVGIVNTEAKLRFFGHQEINHLLYSRESDLHPPTRNISSEYFDPRLPVKIIIHGWNSGVEDPVVELIRKAYTDVKAHNIISCDWAPISNDMFYSRAAHATNIVGVTLGMFIDNLVKTRGVKYSDFHLIGHSLGAHVASAAGKFVKQTLGRITCLDPAAPCFQNDEDCNMLSPLTKISKSDAHMVDVIHTCVGAAGMVEPMGHADFYPNGGSPRQPGCPVLPYFEQSCSHCRSFRYYAESIVNPNFKAVACETWEDFVGNKCTNNTVVSMGENLAPNTTGIFFLKTSDSSPFALGMKGIHP